MQNIILFDSSLRNNLLPLTFTRPVSEIRVGILTIKEKWEHYLNAQVSSFTEVYLSGKYPAIVESENLVVQSSILPNKEFITELENLQPGKALVLNNEFIAAKVSKNELHNIDEIIDNVETIEYKGKLSRIINSWDIFSLNDEELRSDFELLTKGRKSAALSSTVQVLGKENIFIEDGFKGEFFTVNASEGPVYFGKDSEVMEGALIRGPFALSEHATLKLGAKIYGATTIGPHCKVGGEVHNSVFLGYANKAHDGFLGNAVIGEWCNIGADSNNSNLKNNYVEVRLWNYATENFAKTGLQFCGLIMGDHSKCGINTMFNTGTVVGVSANIFGAGFPRNFIPSFSWGGAGKTITYKLSKAMEVVQAVYNRRGKEVTANDVSILEHVFNETEKYRRF